MKGHPPVPDRARRVDIEGAAHLMLNPRVILLQPEEQVWEAMRRGWSVQQTSRLLKQQTLDHRLQVIDQFFRYTNKYPWTWTPSDMEEWSTLLFAERHLAHSTVRNYQNSIALFMDYVTDPRYGWSEECRRRFGEIPVQICHEWNTAEHRDEFEGRPGNRPLTREELDRFFRYADDQVEASQKSGRKGYLAAFRDATLFKVMYAWGLRRRETVMLDLHDFTRNPHAPEFKRYGSLHVRWGKSVRGGSPRRRNVLTVFPWSVEVLEEYIQEVRARLKSANRPYLWLTERGGRVTLRYVNERFAEYRHGCGLPDELGPHCLRHSYITHLIEAGYDPLFVQQQAGHAYASTTAIYTGVSNDFKNRVLREALDRILGSSQEVDG